MNITDSTKQQNILPLSNLFNFEAAPIVDKRFSLGNTILITADNNPQKQSAIQAFAKKDYQSAITSFRLSLQSKPNDPETWIYFYNSLAALSKKTLKISTAVPIGSNLNVAKEILRGVALAQAEINQKGGIDGKLVQIQIINDENNPEIAKQIALELVKDKETLAVIGHNSSDASIAAGRIYQENGLVMISPTSVAKELSGMGNYIYRTTPSTKIIADTLARYVVKVANKSKIVVCSDSQAQASQSFQEEFAWAVFDYGGKIINISCDFAAPQFSFADIPATAITAGADALVLAPSVDNINQAIDVAQANRRRLSLFGSHTMYTFATLKQGLGDINGMVIPVVWHSQTIGNNTFSLKARKFWGNPGSWRTATAYDATIAVFQGLKSAKTRQQLQQNLSNSGFSVDGALGKIEFLPSGDRQGKAVLVRIQPGKNSGAGYDFVPINNHQSDKIEPKKQ